MPETAQLSEVKRLLLAKYLRGKAENASPGLNVIGRRPQGTMAPLSLSQEELWRRELQVPAIPPLYNECVSLQMNGPLNVIALEQALTEIIRRHEIWRTTFETKSGQPVQVIHPVEPVRLPILDLREFPRSKRYPEAIRLMNEEARQPFQFQRGPPLRPTLVRLGDMDHRLFLIAHQIVLDGVSAYQIFPSELAELYRAFITGKTSRLLELPIQCADFACWQREWLDGQMGKQLEYWRKQLGGDLPALKWPDGYAPRLRTYRGVIRPFAFSKEISQKLKGFSHRENSTMFLTLLAGFAALLHRYTDQTDIVVGTFSPCGRKRSEVLKLLGYFLNPVALRFTFGSNPTFVELLGQARNVVAEAISNDDVPIERLARELKLDDSNPSLFFRAAVSLQPSMPSLDLDWNVTSMDVESGGSPWELYLAFIDRPEGVIGRAQFDPDLFDTITITRMLRDLQRLLEELLIKSHQRLSAVNFA